MKASDLALVAWHTLIVYVFLVVAMRVLGRRTMSQLAAADLMVMLLLGSAVETAMVNASTALRAGIVAATVLLAANYFFTRILVRSKRFRHLVNGGPKLLVHNGQVIQEHLWRSGLTLADLKQAMREREIGSIPEVKFAVLEPDGSINFVRRNKPAASQ